MNEASSATTVLDRRIDVAGGELFTRTWTPAQGATASPILLFHDSLGCVALWRDFPAALAVATGRAVIAYDRLGFGQSDARHDRPGLGFVGEEAIGALPALREQLAIDDFIALGHSVGGGMAIHCAAAEPAACRALVTIAAQVFAEERTLAGIRAARVQFQDPAQVERLAKYHGAKARWVLDAWIENWLHPKFAGWTLAPVLPQVRCPVLAIHGVNDEYGTVHHAELIAQLAHGPVQTDIMEDTGHVPHRERPAPVLARIAAFLAAHP